MMIAIRIVVIIVIIMMDPVNPNSLLGKTGLCFVCRVAASSRRWSQEGTPPGEGESLPPGQFRPSGSDPVDE